MRTTLLRAAVCAAASLATAAQAQSDPGVPTRGLAVRILPTSTQDRVVRYEYNGPAAYVRTEAREPGAARNEFPVAIDADTVKALLAAVRLPSEKNEPLFNDAEIDEIAAPLGRALAQANPEQDVCFAVSGRHGAFSAVAPRRVTTGRVVRADGHLNVIFGLVRHDWDNQFKGTGTVIPFEPGRRAAPLKGEPTVGVDDGSGTLRRADWIVFGDVAPVARKAPAPTPAATTGAATAAPPAAAPAAPAMPAPTPRAETPRTDYESVAQRLRTLKRLLDDGLITPQEYEDKRREILKDL